VFAGAAGASSGRLLGARPVRPGVRRPLANTSLALLYCGAVTRTSAPSRARLAAARPAALDFPRPRSASTTRACASLLAVAPKPLERVDGVDLVVGEAGVVDRRGERAVGRWFGGPWEARGAGSVSPSRSTRFAPTSTTAIPGWARSVSTTSLSEVPGDVVDVERRTATDSSKLSRRAGHLSSGGVSNTRSPPPSTAPTDAPSAFGRNDPWASRTTAVRVCPSRDPAWTGSRCSQSRTFSAPTTVVSSAGTSAAESASRRPHALRLGTLSGRVLGAHPFAGPRPVTRVRGRSCR